MRIHRLRRFAEEFRQSHGQLASLSDLEAAGFDKKLVARAVKLGKLQELYVTMTNSAIIKGYKAVK